MATACCQCHGSHSATSAGGRANLPLICLVPRDDPRAAKQFGSGGKPRPASASAGGAQSDFQLLDEDYIKAHFNLPKRALYLDPFRRPLITFPMTQENSKHFNLARKYKVNQQILDGFLDQSEALTAPSVFPYASSQTQQGEKADDNEEIIYILQLPDWEYNCPVHNQTVRTPRFIWHACKKGKEKESGKLKRGGGPLNKPKPWLLSRHTDFDLLSQW
ncbi:hypothetical protein PYW08_000068 [Mythimna loreyi]|uniref:Uncharacterized protein n=1 Tax=Mythimna loreyi TaxID=667449 RepID=A0ACC2R9X3_9NEOP|nr:hypothetical protein PYW08_000068 [Mythimna loreyi]